MDLSMGTLAASLLVSSVGFGIYLYGKREAELPHMLVGLAMMGFPYFVPDPLWMILTGCGLVAGLRLMTR